MREILVFDADYCWRLGCVASEFLMPPELDAECGEMDGTRHRLLELQTTFPVDCIEY